MSSGLEHYGEKPYTEESHSLSTGRLIFQHHNHSASWTLLNNLFHPTSPNYNQD